MEKFMSYVIIIAIIALIVFICYRIVKAESGGDTKGLKENKGKKGSEGSVVNPVTGYDCRDCNDDETLVSPEWQVAQLDPKSGKVIKSAYVTVPSGGKFIIGRSKRSDFVLANASTDVSRNHLGVGCDRDGYFAKPLERDGRIAMTYIGNKLISDSFSLVNGQIIWLSSVPIVFIHRSSEVKQLRFNINSSPRVNGRNIDANLQAGSGKNDRFDR